jgi:GNAT superfamily N-acetyltransferase
LTVGAVDPRFRRRGIHSAYLEKLMAIIKSRGSKAVCVGMRRSNEAVRRAFVKLGWSEVPAPDASQFVYYVLSMGSEARPPGEPEGP